MITTPKAQITFPGGTLEFGRIPRVVGTLSSPAWDLPLANGDAAPDIVEVRLDLIGARRNWLERCRAIEAAGRPVLLTLRLAVEGGKWARPDRARSLLLASALRNLSAVDVELNSEIAGAFARRAKRLGKICILSYHDFDRTPPIAELTGIIEGAQKMASIVKVSTFVRTRRDIETHRMVLRGRWKVPVCVIGMGPLASDTRVSFPTLGSCLTYGYLDKSAAPGQLPAAKLVERLRALMPAYNRDYLARQRQVRLALARGAA